MKITPTLTLTLSHSDLLLPNKPTHRRTNYKTTPRISRSNLKGAGVVNVESDKSPESRRKSTPAVSARRLGAALWRMQVESEVAAAEEDEEGNKRWRQRRKEAGEVGGDRLGFKQGIGHGGGHLSCLHGNRERASEAKDQLRSPGSLNGPTDENLREQKSPFQYANYEMEGATKWDPIDLKQSDDTKLLDQKANATMVTSLEIELEQARVRIEELEVERRASKKKVEHFLKKVSEERSTWRSREHEKVRAIIDDIQGDLSREKKNRQRLEIVNSKLVNELAEVKSTLKRYMQEHEKERKARELIEEVCDELAKEIGEDKTEVDSLRTECMKIREEVDGERKMLQMAEVWREERVQMKLVDAKVALDQKYSQMIHLVEELEKFLNSKGVSLDANELREAELFQRAASSMSIKDIKEFTYETSNSDDIFAVVEEMAMAESNEREIEIEPCVEYSPASHVSQGSKVRTVSPEMNSHSKDIHRLSNVYAYQNGDMDDDGSGWETVSRGEDQGSSYSPEGSIMSVNRMCRDSNVSSSYTEWEEQVSDATPITEISEVYSVPLKQQKKVKSISRLWRSGPNNGDNYKIISVDGGHGRLSNGRISNGTMVSPDRGSSKSGGFSPSNMAGWSSPESGNPHINRGMKGCIEWPRGAQRNSLKNKLMEARMESQKIQLRHVLKEKI